MLGRWFNKGYINTFGALGLFGIAKEAISDATTKPYEAGSMENSILFRRDLDKVTLGKMTQKELDRNIRSGKYRDYSPLPDYDLWIRRIEKKIELTPRQAHNMDKVRLEMVKEAKANKKHLDTTFLRLYEWVDEYL